MNRIIKHPATASIALAMALMLSVGYFARPAVAQAASEPVIHLDQAWSKSDREWFYQVSQGSTVISYDIYRNLEVAGAQELFRSDANSERYGLIAQPANAEWNPDALPIGLTKTVIDKPAWEGAPTGAWMGVTCAACHNAQLNYQGKRIRIDGGVGNMFDLMAIIYALDDAMQETLKDAAKFDRLVARMSASSPDAKSALRKRFESEADRVHTFRTRMLVTPEPWGPARLDAIALIVNRITATEARLPENWSTPLAPTKAPFLWNATQGLWTQWRAVQQDPISRNMIEAMGVFMSMNLHAKTPAEGLFASDSAVLNLQKIENQLNRLAPPSWPEDVLGKIDRAKAKTGEALFIANCSGCHNAWPYTWSQPNKAGKRYLLVGLTAQSYVGTDGGQFDDLRPYAITGQLSDYLPGELKGKKIVPTGDLYYGTAAQLVNRALAPIKLDAAQTQDLHGYRDLPLQLPPQQVYKAAPRDGVWATPPFMHNGSVPNLYEVLLPAKERTKKFYIGREFDPVKVGLDTSGKSGKFLLDTTIRGNSNAGHSFENAPRGNGVIGPLFTDEQRWAIVEYLKSIPETPGPIPPFGAPPVK